MGKMIFEEDFFKFDEQFELPEEILKWGVAEMNRCYKKAKAKKNQQMIMGKVKHTLEVMKAGRDICLKTSETNWNLTQAVVICFLHDIGRFRQALYGTYIDSLSIDHARSGADIFIEEDWSCLDKYSLEPKTIYLTIDKHSRKAYRGKNSYVKLIRDADKLAILSRPENLYMDSLVDGTASEEIIKQFKGKTLVDYKDVKTKVDFYLAILAWPRDFSFKTTQRLFDDSAGQKWLRKQVLTRDPRLKYVLAS